MDLYLVLALLGKIGGTWGPLPYDLAECERRKADMLVQIEAGLVEHPEANIDGASYDFSDVHVECRFADARPELGAPVD